MHQHLPDFYCTTPTLTFSSQDGELFFPRTILRTSVFLVFSLFWSGSFPHFSLVMYNPITILLFVALARHYVKQIWHLHLHTSFSLKIKYVLNRSLALVLRISNLSFTLSNIKLICFLLGLVNFFFFEK